MNKPLGETLFIPQEGKCVSQNVTEGEKILAYQETEMSSASKFMCKLF